MSFKVFLLVILSATLSFALRASLSSSGAAQVTVTFINDQPDPVAFLKWDSPFDTLSGGRAFSVNASGVPVPYNGRVGKRGAPKKEDYMVIHSGDTISTSLDLAEYFNFPQTMNYEVQLVSAELRTPKGVKYSFSDLKVKSDAVSMSIPASTTVTPKAEAVEISFVSCTAAQQTTVTTAWNLYKTLAPKAQAEAARGTLSTSYSTYFGAYSTTRNANVVKVTTNEGTASKGNGYAFNCAPPSCGGSGTYAYVYPNDATTVYLCAAFWKAPTSGWDSTPGVIVHETSHFNVIGGTQDYVYGNAGAKSLATSNPDRAVANADNYEYFAESL